MDTNTQALRSSLTASLQADIDWYAHELNRMLDSHRAYNGTWLDLCQSIQDWIQSQKG
jgi:hypothetical protein